MGVDRRGVGRLRRGWEGAVRELCLRGHLVRSLLLLVGSRVVMLMGVVRGGLLLLLLLLLLLSRWRDPAAVHAEIVVASAAPARGAGTTASTAIAGPAGPVGSEDEKVPARTAALDA